MILLVALLLVPAFQAGAQLTPAWTSAGRDSRYPDSLYIVGVGVARSSGDASGTRGRAENAARSEIARQIESRIRSGARQFSGELAKDGVSTVSASYTSDVQVESDLTLRGVRVVDRFEDRERNVYALAVLDRNLATSEITAELRALSGGMTTLRSALNDSRSQGVERLILSLDRWLRLEEQVTRLQRLLPAITGRPQSITPPTDARSAVERFVSTLRLSAVSGHEQRPGTGGRLSAPLRVSLTAELDGERVPLPGARLDFQPMDVDMVLGRSTATDSNGIASVEIDATPQNAGSALLRVRFAPERVLRADSVSRTWSELLPGKTVALDLKLIPERNAQTIVSIALRPGASSSRAVDALRHELEAAGGIRVTGSSITTEKDRSPPPAYRLEGDAKVVAQGSSEVGKTAVATLSVRLIRVANSGQVGEVSVQRKGAGDSDATASDRALRLAAASVVAELLPFIQAPQ